MAREDSMGLSIQQLRELVDYDPDAGTMEVRRPPVPYPSVTVEGRTYSCHRLAWALTTGEWPEGEVDHRNGDPTDFCFANLRDVPHGVNIQNQRAAQRSNKSSGLLGVTVKPNGKAQARIWVDGKNLYLGQFDDPNDAHTAYVNAKREHHPGCTL